MPSCLVYIQPYCIPSKLTINIFKTIQESFSITIWCSNHTDTTQERSNPTKNVESLMMLTICGDTQPYSLFSPASPQPWMQSEPSFILKNKSLFRLKILKFFLMPSETLWHPLSELVDKNNWHFSNCSLTDEANTVPDAPLSLCQNASPDELPMLDHPIELDLYQNPVGTFLYAVPVLLLLPGLIEKDDQSWISFLMPLILLRLLCASTDSNFDASVLKLLLSIPDADPPISAIEPLSLCLYRLQEFSEQTPKDALGLLRDALRLNLDFSCFMININVIICQFIYCVCISRHKGYEIRAILLIIVPAEFYG